MQAYANLDAALDLVILVVSRTALQHLTIARLSDVAKVTYMVSPANKADMISLERYLMLVLMPSDW